MTSARGDFQSTWSAISFWKARFLDLKDFELLWFDQQVSFRRENKKKKNWSETRWKWLDFLQWQTGDRISSRALRIEFKLGPATWPKENSECAVRAYSWATLVAESKFWESLSSSDWKSDPLSLTCPVSDFQIREERILSDFNSEPKKTCREGLLSWPKEKRKLKPIVLTGNQIPCRSLSPLRFRQGPRARDWCDDRLLPQKGTKLRRSRNGLG